MSIPSSQIEKNHYVEFPHHDISTHRRFHLNISARPKFFQEFPASRPLPSNKQNKNFSRKTNRRRKNNLGTLTLWPCLIWPEKNLVKTFYIFDKKFRVNHLHNLSCKSRDESNEAFDRMIRGWLLQHHCSKSSINYRH